MNCCTTHKIDCRQGRDCPARNAPLHSGNGGNTVTDGQALRKPVYTGGDLIDPVTSWFAVGLLVCGLLWFVGLLVLAYRAGRLS